MKRLFAILAIAAVIGLGSAITKNFVHTPVVGACAWQSAGHSDTMQLHFTDHGVLVTTEGWLEVLTDGCGDATFRSGLLTNYGAGVHFAQWSYVSLYVARNNVQQFNGGTLTMNGTQALSQYSGSIPYNYGDVFLVMNANWTGTYWNATNTYNQAWNPQDNSFQESDGDGYFDMGCTMGNPSLWSDVSCTGLVGS